MRNAPRLSICIPTFNRLQYLEGLINSLLPKAKLGCVEVCISNNHSTDGTGEYLEKLAQREGTTLKIASQYENIGIDRNMIAAIAMASGNYIYPLGDDDFLSGECVDSILEEIEKDADLIILNGWHTDSSLSKLRVHLNGSHVGFLTHNPEMAFKMFWDKMPFGSFIAKRGCFINNYFERYLDTSHAYTGAVWDALSHNYESRGSCTVISMKTPTVLLRGAEKTWRRDAALIMLREIPHWFILIAENKIYKKVAKEVRQDYINSQANLVSLLSFRMAGQLEVKDVPLLSLECSKKQKIQMALIARIPFPLLKVLKALRANIKAVYCQIYNAKD